MALQNNFFNFDSKIYKQTDEVAMGSRLGPSLANAFLCFDEQICLNDSPEDFKPVYLQKICRCHNCPISFTWSPWKVYKLFKFETERH